MRLCCAALSLLLLAACTASWRAPVESRGQRTVARPAPPSRPSISGDSYRVQRGDTLYGIAWQSGIDYRAIAAWNGIRAPYRIYAGQSLRLRPPPPVRTPPAPPAPRPSTQARAPRVSPPGPSPSSPSPSSTVRALQWHWPVQGRVVSTFRKDDPLRKGVKIAGKAGDPIRAAENGKVVYSGSGLIGYGRLIIVKHNDNFLSAYGHNRKILVAEGDQVTKGQKIAEMGTANNGDALLHFEIRRDGKPVDPVSLLPRR
ncbi:MAG: peptidoglycan DD-metalloendopeptidase family protein [Chromatiaceae bacterium]|nr:peptidoglycan DD-metalloendopeptidase family protein [Gammaproteobacteria bacterium]MCP5307113.1 peptidoglycan DD-metalloendopeptidase family protein [Chromatiaceae bacterium]MCP5312306.1 peptidoglycan DD-metalloendopeptidase family protein [Chromatiaceae bacterium]